MKLRVGINGFGRIGRTAFRILKSRSDEFDVVLINDPAEPKILGELLKYDTVHGRFAEQVTVDGAALRVGGTLTHLSQEHDPQKIGWKAAEVDVVLESSGRFSTREGMAKHLAAGAPRVLLSAPVKGSEPIDLTVILGVNDDKLTRQMKLVSNASCTTNCVVPMVKVLQDRFGIAEGLMTTVHAYTNTQELNDGPNKDPRRARAAAQNIIPTTTGAANLVGTIIPELFGKLTGVALRVPVACGSITDLTVLLKNAASVVEVNAAFKQAASEQLKGIVEYTEEPVVSSDVIGNPHSCVFDGSWTRIVDGNFVKVFGWYDNEFGYSMRTVDVLKRMCAV